MQKAWTRTYDAERERVSSLTETQIGGAGLRTVSYGDSGAMVSV